MTTDPSVPHTDSRNADPPSRLRALLTGTAMTLLCLLVVEALARIVGTIDADLSFQEIKWDDAWLQYSPTLGWEFRPGFDGVAGLGRRTVDSRGFLTVDTEQVTNRRGKRVLFIGDSNTMGYGVSMEESFVEVADRLLPGVDAINLGAMAYTSYQGHQALVQHLPALQPDAIVVSFNYNDRRYVLSEHDVDSAEHFERLYQASRSRAGRVLTWLERSYAFRALRVGMRKIGLLPTPVAELRLDALPRRVSETRYREYLTKMARLAREHEIPMIFVVLEDNPILTAHLRKGVASLDAGQYDLAIAYFNDAINNRLVSTLARQYLAQAYRRRGDSVKAGGLMNVWAPPRAIDGQIPIVLDTVYHAIMREVGSQYAVDVVDAAAVLRSRPEVYIDACHFNAIGHKLIGELLASRIAHALEPGRE